MGISRIRWYLKPVILFRDCALFLAVFWRSRIFKDIPPVKHSHFCWRQTRRIVWRHRLSVRITGLWGNKDPNSSRFGNGAGEDIFRGLKERTLKLSQQGGQRLTDRLLQRDDQNRLQRDHWKDRSGQKGPCSRMILIDRGDRLFRRCFPHRVRRGPRSFPDIKIYHAMPVTAKMVHHSKMIAFYWNLSSGHVTELICLEYRLRFWYYNSGKRDAF